MGVENDISLTNSYSIVYLIHTKKLLNNFKILYILYIINKQNYLYNKIICNIFKFGFSIIFFILTSLYISPYFKNYKKII